MSKPVIPFPDKAHLFDMPSDTSCWLFKGKSRSGARQQYGMVHFIVDGQRCYERAHKALYRYFKGEVPEGAHLHHTCEVPLCANPAHLEVLTHAEHKARHHGTRDELAELRFRLYDIECAA